MSLGLSAKAKEISMKTYIRTFLGFLTLLALLPQSVPAQEWERFREAYRYHIQAIALSPRHQDGSRTLIISEPPPFVSLADITGLDPVLQSADTRKLRLGVDGWVQDVVIALPPLEATRINRLINGLQIKLFGTSYKAYVVPIPEEGATVQHTALNLSVTSGDLKGWVLGRLGESWGDLIKWFLLALLLLAIAIALAAAKRYFLAFLLLVGAGAIMLNTSGLMTLAFVALLTCLLGIGMLGTSKRIAGGVVMALGLGLMVYAGGGLIAKHRGPETKFASIFGGKPLDCASILKQRRNGVFLSTKPGLVLWSFSTTTPLDSHGIEIREFALDSDLILGAVSSGGQVAVIARERSTPVTLLPPLRTETILQLAGAKEDELSQSYERNNPFSGRYDEVGLMDWAPIYLSPRLIDTEYGSLLNITDQLLKGWSTHDNVKYVNFPYPEPSSYPFEKNLMDVLKTKELTFNWNTKGAGYVTKAGDFEVYALNKTGSLPIDYLARGNPGVQQAEDRAYQYYSTMSDPNLIRVVQYAALYQIFHHYSVVASDHPEPAPLPPSSPLIEPIRALVDQLPDSIDGIIDNIADEEIREQLANTRKGLQALRTKDPSGELRDKLVGALATRDGFPEIESLPKNQKQFLFSLMSDIQEISDLMVSPRLRNGLRLRFASITGARASRWIHTPSIVESQGTADVVGGHNLSSQVTNFLADSSVAHGDVTVEETASGLVVHFNPEDEDTIGTTVRQAARDDQVDADEIRSRIKATLGSEDVKPQAFDAGLGFTDSLHPDPLRGFQNAHAPGSMEGIGWRRGGEAISSKDLKMIQRLGGSDARAVLVARDSHGAYVISAPPAEPIEAYDLASSTDAFVAVTRDSAEGQVSVHFRGFDDRQAEGFVRNVDAHSDVRLKIASTEKDFTPEQLTDILKGKYDWNRAELVKEPEVVVLPDSTREVHTELSVPSRDAGRPGLIVRVKVTLAHAFEVTQEFLSEFARLLHERFLAAPADQDAQTIAKLLVDDLKKDQRFADVQAQVRHDDKTVFYVEKQEVYFPWKQTVDFAA
jgi:hypothetical protein